MSVAHQMPSQGTTVPLIVISREEVVVDQLCFVISEDRRPSPMLQPVSPVWSFPASA